MFLIWIMVAVYIYSIYSKWSFNNVRNKSKKLKAIVHEYRNEKGPMRNDYTKIDYPYVSINNERNLVKLFSANSFNRKFKVGEEVLVFWHNNKLLYWNEYNRGLNKFIL